VYDVDFNSLNLICNDLVHFIRMYYINKIKCYLSKNMFIYLSKTQMNKFYIKKNSSY